MDWATAVTDRQALRQALIAQEEQDRERAEERKKKDAKRKRDERKSESPTMKQRKEANCKKSAAYKRKKRADEKAKEDSYKDRCKTAGCQYVPPVRKEKAADREFRHDQMDEQISLREDAKENERVRKEATRLSAKLDMFCSFLSDKEFGPVGSNSRKMFFVHSEWDEDRCKEACRKLHVSRITGADAYVRLLLPSFDATEKVTFWNSITRISWRHGTKSETELAVVLRWIITALWTPSTMSPSTMIGQRSIIIKSRMQ